MKNINLFIKYNIEGYKYLLCQTLIMFKIFNDYTLYEWAKSNYIEYEKKNITNYEYFKKEVAYNKRLNIFKKIMSFNNMLLFITFHMLLMFIVIKHFNPTPINILFISLVAYSFIISYFLKHFYNFERFSLNIQILKNENEQTSKTRLVNQNMFNFDVPPIDVIAGFMIYTIGLSCNNKFLISRMSEFVERNFLSEGKRINNVKQTISNIMNDERYSEDKIRALKDRLISVSLKKIK